MVLWRELGGKAVGEKSVAEENGVGYREDLQWAKKSTPPVWGWVGEDFEKPLELYCMCRSSCFGVSAHMPKSSCFGVFALLHGITPCCY